MMPLVRYSRGTSQYDNRPEQREAADFSAFAAAVLGDRAVAKGLTYICAPFAEGQHNDSAKYPGTATWRAKNLARPRAFLPFDFDGFADPGTFAQVREWLIRFQGFGYTTASHTPDAPRCRVVLAQTRETSRDEGIALCLGVQRMMERDIGAGRVKLDVSVYKGEQPLFTPLHEAEAFSFNGLPVDVDAVLAEAPPVGDQAPQQATPAARAVAIAFDDTVLQKLHDLGFIKSEQGAGKYAVVCPCSGEHTSESTEKSTVYYLPNFGGVKYGKFHCLHAHCHERPQEQFLEALGLNPREVWRHQNGGKQGNGVQPWQVFGPPAELPSGALAAPPLIPAESFPVPCLPTADSRDGTANTRPLTELGNAQRLSDAYGKRLRYVPEAKSWLVWNDDSWQWNDGSGVRSLAAQLPPTIYREGDGYIQDAEHFAKWARKSQERRTIDATTSLLADFPFIRLPLAKVDADSYMIGFDRARQVIDLRNGTVRAATPSDYVTKSLAVENLGDATKAVRWLEFLDQVFSGDQELIDWIQRFVGYMLTGSTQEQIFLFLFGLGANGKSVFIELLKHVMGDYARAIAPETLAESRRQAGAATPDLAALIGARLVVSNETEDNTALSESLVKGLVSGDTLPVRGNYQDPVQFTPGFKLLMAGNHKPIVRGTDGGIWRRVRLVPFNRTFPPNERDPHLLEKLKRESPHILAWAVVGCLDWQQRGLADTPATVRKATDAYQVDQDLIGRWLAECTEADPSAETLTGDLYRNYQAWCLDSGLKPATNIALGRKLAERGYGDRKSVGKRFRCGLRLTDSRRYGLPPPAAAFASAASALP
jgi:P4 family phage/plasmid primase-like protien